MHTSENTPMNTSEIEQAPAVVELIAPDGLGFGEGGISVKQQLEEGTITEEVPKLVYEFLTTDPNAFKPIEELDDGCGDGRPWWKIIEMVPDGKGGRKIAFRKSSSLRAKVFGGGLVVGASMWRTIKGAPRQDETIGRDRQFIVDAFAACNFSHGAHTDEHAQPGNCGCGAIDNYQKITMNALKYRTEITSTLEALYGDTFAKNKYAINAAYEVYQALAETEEYFVDAGGEQSMDQILKSGAVVKELAGHHIEETIVINEVPGTTLDQQYFTQEIKNRAVEKPSIIQAFSVDVWRGKQIAEVVTATALEEDPSADAEAIYKLAYADFLIRTLAVAGTLTAGDLPVYRRRAA